VSSYDGATQRTEGEAIHALSMILMETGWDDSDDEVGAAIGLNGLKICKILILPSSRSST
jgi:hypothetical protein